MSPSKHVVCQVFDEISVSNWDTFFTFKCFLKSNVEDNGLELDINQFMPYIANDK